VIRAPVWRLPLKLPLGCGFWYTPQRFEAGEIMMKKSLMTVAVCFMCAAALCAETAMVDFTKLPNDAALRAGIDGLRGKEVMFRFYVPDDFWKFSPTKAQVADSVEAVFRQVESLITGGASGIDLRLYRVLLMSYLYNLDRGDYHDVILSATDELKRDFPGDYRPYWARGFHVSETMDVLDSLEDFQYIVDHFPQKELLADFWDDFGRAAGLCVMPSHAMAALETAAGIRGGFTAESGDLYARIKKGLKRPEDAPDMKVEDFMKVGKIGDDFEITARPFGIRFTIPSAWEVGSLAVQKNAFIIGAQSPSIGIPGGKQASYSILLMNQARPAATFEAFKADIMGNLKNAVKVALDGIDARWEVYEVRDSSLYSEIGGMHGYIAFLRAAEPKVKGLAIEKLGAPPRTGEGGSSYWVLKDLLIRYDGDIHYMVLLDSCEGIFKQSQEDFLKFMRGIVIE
jgi:hypothetical protein